MIEFMVLSAPRSGSTWASNWLTTERTLCLHDPVLEHAPEDFDSIACDRRLGISCTATPLLPDFVNRHRARKLIVHRDIADINRSLEHCGMTRLESIWDGALDKLEGLHVQHTALFNPAQARVIWRHLLGTEMDDRRHRLLTDMHIDPNFGRLRVVPARARAFVQRVREALA
jgi:hypothetical protein